MFFIERKFKFPDQLAHIISQVNWKSLEPDSNQIQASGNRLKKIWPTLAENRGQATSSHYSNNQELAQVYAEYYLMANALKPALLLEEMRLLGLNIFNNEPLHWLDVGSGPGTLLTGLCWWSHVNKNKICLTQLEQSKYFLRNSEELFGALHKQLDLSHCQINSIQGDANQLSQFLHKTNPKVISFSNSLSECKDRRSILQTILAYAKNNPIFLMIIEPGSQAASRDLLLDRDFLRQAGQAQILLPCLDNRPCGALADPKDWCHELAECEFPDWFNQIGAQAGLRKESLLFSYLVAKLGITESNSALPAQNRIVSQLLKQKGQNTCYLCTAQGKIKTRVQHSKATAKNEYFLSAQKGDLFKEVHLGPKGDVEAFIKIDAPPLCEKLFPKLSS